MGNRSRHRVSGINGYIICVAVNRIDPRIDQAGKLNLNLDITGDQGAIGRAYPVNTGGGEGEDDNFAFIGSDVGVISINGYRRGRSGHETVEDHLGIGEITDSEDLKVFAVADQINEISRHVHAQDVPGSFALNQFGGDRTDPAGRATLCKVYHLNHAPITITGCHKGFVIHHADLPGRSGQGNGTKETELGIL